MGSRAVTAGFLALIALCGFAGASALADEAPLADAIKAGEQVTIDALLARGTAVNAAQPDGSTALHWAAYRNDAGLVKTLLARGAKADVRNSFGATPLGEAAKLANADIVRLLLAAGANAESANADGETALMLAARTGSVPVAQLLLARGANVNAREAFRGQTALMWAAGNSRPEMVELLLAHKAKPDLRADFNDWGAQITSEPRAVPAHRWPHRAAVRRPFGLRGLHRVAAEARGGREPAEPRRRLRADDLHRQPAL